MYSIMEHPNSPRSELSYIVGRNHKSAQRLSAVRKVKTRGGVFVKQIAGVRGAYQQPQL